MGDVVVPPAFIELTFERYADVTVSAGGSYTPAVSGFFALATVHDDLAGDEVEPQLYSSATATWLCMHTVDSYRPFGGMLIGDGTNLRIKNSLAANKAIVLMRAGYSKPNPTPRVGSIIRKFGTEIIVFESDKKGFIWIERDNLTKLWEDIFLDVREAKERGEPHPLIGKTLALAIKEDVEDKMGYGKYKTLLRALGYDV